MKKGHQLLPVDGPMKRVESQSRRPSLTDASDGKGLNPEKLTHAMRRRERNVVYAEGVRQFQPRVEPWDKAFIPKEH